MAMTRENVHVHSEAQKLQLQSRVGAVPQALVCFVIGAVFVAEHFFILGRITGPTLNVFGRAVLALVECHLSP